ncbi:MAG: hypothetical protein LBQ50_09810 [Planctomycetaceae bacterium]|jgi:hypothetical protein|nr:hypothetical protein [Planctomycetaceae bacterium]
MNIYFLLEGKRTEMKVYPAWLSFLVPHFNRVMNFDDVTKNHYFLFSGNGFPSLFHHLKNAINDINQQGNFDYLVLCLDAENVTPEERYQEVQNYLYKNNLSLSSKTKLEIVVQNKCIETWFLGNRTFFKRNPESQTLRTYINHFNVFDKDPEKLMAPPAYKGSIASFHVEYFREICRERNTCYTKTHPGVVTEEPFLQELIRRCSETGDIASFEHFLKFCANISGNVIVL